ncbi:MAG: glycosyltransferase family 2 protein [Tidjanibacter sp.]|nr:glycosyltransferase family 2 protein [Tidjanibacter sp.]
MINYSIIIPHYNSIVSLRRLLKSIPIRNDIEVIIIDNSPIPIGIDDIGVEGRYILLYSDHNRYAGGARNVGLDKAKGEWLIFADADDFFQNNAFSVFDEYCTSNADLIYFKVASVYDDTLEPAERHKEWNLIIDKYNKKEASEIATKLQYVVPWGKMIRRALVVENAIKFDEVVAANDVMFSTICACRSKRFVVDNRQVYVVTITYGSLANRRDTEVIESRFRVALRRNSFLRKEGLTRYQGSVMYFLYQALRKDVCLFVRFIFLTIKYKQNIFIGASNWLRTFLKTRRAEKRTKQYLTE